MANQFQQIIVEGHLSADPELRYAPNGTAVMNFRFGSNYEYKSAAGEKVKETTWYRATVWGKMAEALDFLAKGSHVFVVGRLKPGPDGTPKVFQLSNGNYSASYEIKADTVRVLSSGEAREVSEVTEDTSDDIPF